MEFKIGDKIRFKRKLSDCGILKAKTGQIGSIVEIKKPEKIGGTNYLTKEAFCIKLKNGVVVEIKGKNDAEKHLEHYVKEERLTYKNATNKEILEMFQLAIAKECQATSVKTKSYQKLLLDIVRLEQEIMNRMK